jgi:hypothetical protein
MSPVALMASISTAGMLPNSPIDNGHLLGQTPGIREQPFASHGAEDGLTLMLLPLFLLFFSLTEYCSFPIL